MTKLIGLTGPAGSGKDTIAMILRAKYDYHQLALADPIRRGISAMFRIPEEYFIERDLKEHRLGWLCDKTPRQVMQTLGTEWARNHVHPDIWIKTAQRDIDGIFDAIHARKIFKSGVVVSDIRFQNEADWIRNQGGIVWHIRRPDNPYEIVTGHISEVPITPIKDEPYIINDDDINKLQTKIASTIDKMEAAA